MTYNFNYAQFWQRDTLKKEICIDQVKFELRIFNRTKQKPIKTRGPDE